MEERRFEYNTLVFQKHVDQILKENKKERMILLRLTVKNVEGSSLSATLTHLNDSFPRFLKYSRLSQVMSMYARAIIQRYNPERQDYRVYVDCLFLSSDYFDQKITFEELQTSWKKALKIDYDPIVKAWPTKKGNSTSYLEACDKQLQDFFRNLEQSTEHLDAVQKAAIVSRKLLTFGGRLNHKN